MLSFNHYWKGRQETLCLLALAKLQMPDLCSYHLARLLFLPPPPAISRRFPAFSAFVEDISDEDAVFLANMETACALSQDAAPLVGESVAVFGAGTVGALTAAVLAHQGYSVTVIDPETDRVATLLQRFPQISCSAGKDFDVCVEVSGSADALGSAIKSCRRGGTVVLGYLSLPFKP